MPIFDSDKALTVYGVPGRLTHRTTIPGETRDLWCRQRWISEDRAVDGYGAGARIRAEIRYDDDCGNGHNTFAITGEIYSHTARGQKIEIAGGCLHEEIARVFPELGILIPWHLCSSDGPLHYVANTVYHAGDRDHNGLRKGEIRQIRSGKTGLPSWKLIKVDRNGMAVTEDPPR